MNATLGHLCAHTGYTGHGKPPEDDEMKQATLPSRHRIQISNTPPLSVTVAPYNIEYTRVSGEEKMCL